MIQETYVTLKQAKALKELGFPINFYEYDEIEYNDSLIDIESIQGYMQMPSQSIVQKWLREKKDLFIDIYLIRDTIHLYGYLIYKLIGSSNTIGEGQGTNYATYEEALSAGIDKCIELLKEK